MQLTQNTVKIDDLNHINISLMPVLENFKNVLIFKKNYFRRINKCPNISVKIIF